MPPPPIRVLVVDDAVVVRRLVANILEDHPAFETPVTAANGKLALAKLEQSVPDAIVLDIEMPEMDGLATLPEIRRLHPRLPVIMFSTLTESGAAATLHALSLGATDYVTKPSNTGSFDVAMNRVRDELIPKLLAFTGRPASMAEPAGVAAVHDSIARPFRVRPSTAPAAPSTGPRPAAAPVELVAIGCSTGGPNALAVLLERLGSVPVPIVVTQHIPPVFSKMLAQRLDKLAAMEVREAAHGDRLTAGTVFIAPGDHHLVLRRDGRGVELRLDDGAPENSCRPSVDVMYRSIAETHGASALAIVLTGMGYDGLRGAEVLHGLGARIIVQDKDSSVVWGMPGAISDAGLADAVVPLELVADQIARRVGHGRAGSAAQHSSLTLTATPTDSTRSEH